LIRRPARPRASKTQRALALRVESLEVRQLLSTVPSVVPDLHTTFSVSGIGPFGSPGGGPYTPAQIQQAYGFNKIAFGATKGDGTGQTIAIVDAYDDPNIQADLNAFNLAYGLPAVTVNRVNQTGGTTYPSTDSAGGWELEVALDVEWAHAMAPGAKIMLVEANSPTDADLLAAVDYAASHANVVSMSWGGGEFSAETSSAYDGHFIKPGVAFVASSGDRGAPVSWPSSSPNVLSVGGTALTLGTNNVYGSEVGWSGSGGGPSAYEAKPSYQAGVVTQTSTARANPDVAYNASPSTGFSVFDSYPYGGTSYGWLGIGGTSAGSPQWAALLAIADQGRSLSAKPALNSAGPQEVMTTLYKNATAGIFHDVTGGTSSGSPNYTAVTGYDYVTGVGSPIANLVVQALDGTLTQRSDHLAVTARTPVTAGTSFSVTVSALNTSNATDTAYTGTIHFTSSDVQAGLPANYAFVAADGGSHTFTVALKTAGTQSVTATDTANASATGTASGIVVNPEAASKIVLSGLATSAVVGAAQTLTVTAKDAYNNTATGYADTVHFTSSDAAAVMPANYTFTTADKGVHAFSVTFKTAGTQSLTATGSPSGLNATQSGIAVTPAVPLSLKATANSSSQITLTWSASAGATGGYLVERSTSATTGFAQIGTTPAGTTSFTNTGLAAGTIYYYRVRATGGGRNSTYSNVANATTVVSTTTDSIWSNSYTPSENSYSSGAYDLGVKFKSSVAGTVTAVRFYKLPQMGGYTHVGYLWSTSGTLLASASFTNETASGWQQVSFSSPVAISANTVYIVSYSTGGGFFGATSGFFNTSGVVNGPLQAMANTVAGGDGVYGKGNSFFPNWSGSGANFWVDVAFKPSSGGVITRAVTAPSSPSTGGSASTFGLIAPDAPGTATNGETNHQGTAAPRGPASYSPTSWVAQRAARQVVAQGFSTDRYAF
jgi:hypothetical protein